MIPLFWLGCLASLDCVVLQLITVITESTEQTSCRFSLSFNLMGFLDFIGIDNCVICEVSWHARPETSAAFEFEPKISYYYFAPVDELQVARTKYT